MITGPHPDLRLNGGVNPHHVRRFFEDADAEDLTELLHAAYAELGAMGLNYTAVDQDSTTTLTRARGGQCWVVEHDGRLIGSLTMSLPASAGLQELTPQAREPRRAWLNQVAVSPAFRGLGIASDLWLRARQWASAQGATSVGVDTAIPAERLVRLYESWGFAPVGSIHWPGKTYDSVVMTQPLEPESA